MKKVFIIVAILGVIGLVAILLRPKAYQPSQIEKENTAELQKLLNQNSRQNDLAHKRKAERTKKQALKTPEVNPESIIQKRLEKKRKERTDHLAEHQHHPNHEGDRHAPVKADVQIGFVAPKELRPLTDPQWDNIKPITWKQLQALYTGFTLGQKVGGDFKKEIIESLNGRAVKITGVVMPAEEEEKHFFWLVDPEIITAGCIFCNPPSFGDLIFVNDPEQSVPKLKKQNKKEATKELEGIFEIGPGKSDSGIEYLFGLTIKNKPAQP